VNQRSLEVNLRVDTGPEEIDRGFEGQYDVIVAIAGHFPSSDRGGGSGGYRQIKLENY
jgi:hypothetical protein